MKLNTLMLRGLVRAAILLSGGVLSWGKLPDGNLGGVVLDASGAAIRNAAVAIENIGTGLKSAAATDGVGRYQFNSLPVGHYRVTASAIGFQTVTLADITVELSRTASAYVTLPVGAQNDSITVTDTPSLIDTTTAQLANLYSSRMMTEMATSANPTAGYINVALLGAGVASSGGVGAGTGPSVGGQRPRNNNFTVEGTDNNRKDITGPVVVIPTDAVEEFTLLQNQFSAEFGHSNGGQFNTVARAGANETHGKVYEYFQNRNLNALDTLAKLRGFSRTRYDSNLLGGTLGGAVRRDRWFYFANFDYNPLGRSVIASATQAAPTAAGYAALTGLSGISQTNLNVLQTYLGTAAGQEGSVTVLGRAIPIGSVPVLAPDYRDSYRGLGSSDYNLSSRDQLRARYVLNRATSIDTAASLPAFWTSRPTAAYLGSLSELHTFSPTLANEVRVGFNRFRDRRTVPDNLVFPGMNAFPTIGITDIGASVGPFTDSPQLGSQTIYQIADNVTWNKGRHDFRFGFDGRDSISAMGFLQSARGEYRYSTLDRYLRDISPDRTAQRTVGGIPYSGNALAYYLYANDNWRASRRLTLNLGLRWEYNGVSKSMKEQALNSVANVPGVITFAAPKAQLTNFAPRVGFAYSPTNRGTTSIRGGFGLGYDQIFDNIGNNVRPPQSGSLFSTPLSAASPNYLAQGGVVVDPNSVLSDPAQARARTTGWLPDQKLGYAVNWNLGVQQSFLKDWVVDVRYLGTRGVHLLSQTVLNKVALVTPSQFLPVYLTAPSQAELNALTVTSAQFSDTSKINPWLGYGFSNSLGVTSYVPQGNSIYHGLAIDVSRRFADSFLVKGGYTWSHLRDDSTAEVNTTTLSPRRPQDFRNMRGEWADSALDRRQRLTVAWMWDTPWFARRIPTGSCAPSPRATASRERTPRNPRSGSLRKAVSTRM